MANFAVLLFLVLVALIQMATGETVEEALSAEDKVIFACKDYMASFKSMDDLHEFTRGLQKIANEKHTSKDLVMCVKQKESVFEFDTLIRETGTHDVCHPTHIDRLIAYHYKYLHQTVRQYLFSGLSRVQVFIKQFFRRYAQAVSLTCNQNIYYNLIRSFYKLDHKDRNYDKFNHLIGDHIDILEDPDVPKAIQTELLTIVRSIERPDQIELIGDLSRELRLATVGQYPVEYEYMMKRRIQQCQVLAKHYESPIKAIPRLAAIGYGWKFETIKFYDLAHQEQIEAAAIPVKMKRMLARWLKIVQRCDALLNLRIEFKPVQSASMTFMDERAALAKANPMDSSEAIAFEQNSADFKINFSRLSNGEIKANTITEFQHQHAMYSPSSSHRYRDQLLRMARDKRIRIVEDGHVEEKIRQILDTIESRNLANGEEWNGDTPEEI